MKGQVWQDYVLVFAGVLLVAVGALAYVYKPSIDAMICTTAYMRTQSEAARQEFLKLTDYTVYIFSCDLESDPPEVNIVCKCADSKTISGAVKDELKKFGIDTPKINVKYVK